MTKEEIDDKVVDIMTKHGSDSHNAITGFIMCLLEEEQSYDKLSNLVGDLREVFPFPESKSYEGGYDQTKSDGWDLASIVHSPEMCLEVMIKLCKADLVAELKDIIPDSISFA